MGSRLAQPSLPVSPSQPGKKNIDGRTQTASTAIPRDANALVRLISANPSFFTCDWFEPQVALLPQLPLIMQRQEGWAPIADSLCPCVERRRESLKYHSPQSWSYSSTWEAGYRNCSRSNSRRDLPRGTHLRCGKRPHPDPLGGQRQIKEGAEEARRLLLSTPKSPPSELRGFSRP